MEVNIHGAIYNGLLYLPDPHYGHKEIKWDDEKSLEKAKKIFEEKIKAGWKALKERTPGVWEPIEKFDEKAGHILVLPMAKPSARGG